MVPVLGFSTRLAGSSGDEVKVQATQTMVGTMGEEISIPAVSSMEVCG